MKDSKVIAVMLVVFMLLLMTIGVLFMVRPGVIDNRRAAKEAEIIAMIEASGGSVEIPDMQLPEVQGEEDETFGGPRDYIYTRHRPENGGNGRRG